LVGWIETAAGQGTMNRRGHSSELFLLAGFTRSSSRRFALARWAATFAVILFVLSCPLTARAASPAELISSFRLAHGEGKVTIDPVLNRIAQEQAQAMAARGVLDHSVLKPFSARVATLNSERAAENLAYGYDSFPKTLDQWIGSSGHRQNLLMHDATRIGIASAKSPKSGDTYWAMVISGPEPTREGSAKGGKAKPCRLMLNDLCM
jgi:uncharacterized protein YkwD